VYYVDDVDHWCATVSVQVEGARVVYAGPGHGVQSRDRDRQVRQGAV